MALVTPSQVSFNGGEQSPRIAQRVDQNARAIGLSEMTGWLPLLQGPAEAAPGTIHVAAAKGPCRLIPFEFNVTQGYQIEAGDAYLRFFTNDAQIMDGGTPYEIVAPWSEDEVADIRWQQSNDVLYMVHGGHAPRILSRTGADAFALSTLTINNGPFEARNGDKTVTLSASAAGGVGDTVTLSASEDLFAAGDVGGLVEMEVVSLSTIGMWEPGIEIASGQYCQWGGKVYQRTGGQNLTGTVAPTHSEGAEYDGTNGGEDINGKGPYGVQWTYRYDRYGLVRITGYTSATQVTAEVIRPLASTAATWRWRFGAFSDRRGWPSHVCLWQDRLVLVKDATLYGSVQGDYTDFSIRNEFGDISLDMAFTLTLPNPNVVQWLLPDRELIVGTARAEHIISGGNEGVGPGSLIITTSSDYGSAAANVLRADGRVVYIQRAKQKVRQFSYDGNALYRQESPDLSRYAEHIGEVGFEELVFQKEPEQLIWARRGDGSLAAAAFMPDELLLGWATRPLANGVLCKSLSACTDPDGRYDQVWLAVQKGDDWHICRMEQIRRSSDASMAQAMVDMAVQLTGPITDIVIPILANETVHIVCDGKVHRPLTLDADGAGTLDYSANAVTVGLPYEAVMRLWPIEGGSENGTSQNKVRRIARVDIALLKAAGLELSVQGNTRHIENVTGATAPDSAIAPISDFVTFECGGNSSRVDDITIARVHPQPATVAAVIAHFDVGQR